MGQVGGRGHLTHLDVRMQLLELIDEAIGAGARQRQACEVLGLSVRTLQRWQRSRIGDKRSFREWIPPNKLSDAEQQELLALLVSKKYRDLPPAQIVADLADDGRYIASESTMYRLLENQSLLAHRQNSKPPRKKQKPETHTATGPNQVWTWDITYLPTTVKGSFLYLYMIVDLYSRKIVGFDVHDEQSSDHAADLARLAHQQEAPTESIVLHSDNGSPMKGVTMLATLQNLGILPSFSRPRVSNDNAFSEALFRTLKYRPCYPSKPFDGLREARDWVVDFVSWYNNEHRHSGIKYVRPNERHEGRDRKILKNRHSVYEGAKERHPERWSREIRNWKHESKVELNPIRNDSGHLLEAEQLAC